MQSILGQPVVSVIIDPGGLVATLGARIEVPVTRAIVSAWTAAAKVGAIWTVSVPSPLTAGDYQFVWRTNDAEPPAFEAFVPLTVAVATTVGTTDPAAIAPTRQEVADLLVQRTGRAINDDTPAGVFGTTTRPTAVQVDRFITVAATDVISRVGVRIPASQLGQARELAAMWASVLAELSAVPGGSSDQDRSVAPQYMGAYLARLEDLKAACGRQNVRLV